VLLVVVVVVGCCVVGVGVVVVIVAVVQLLLLLLSLLFVCFCFCLLVGWLFLLLLVVLCCCFSYKSCYFLKSPRSPKDKSKKGADSANRDKAKKDELLSSRDNKSKKDELLSSRDNKSKKDSPSASKEKYEKSMTRRRRNSFHEKLPLPQPNKAFKKTRRRRNSDSPFMINGDGSNVKDKSCSSRKRKDLRSSDRYNSTTSYSSTSNSSSSSSNNSATKNVNTTSSNDGGGAGAVVKSSSLGDVQCEPEVKKVKDTLLSVSRLLLSSESMFFRSLFSNGMRETDEKEVRLEVPPGEREYFVEVIYYLYHGRFTKMSISYLFQVHLQADKVRLKLGSFWSTKVALQYAPTTTH